MKSNKKNKYQEYIRSSEWAKVRGDLILVRGDNCEYCSKRGTQVHHLHYRNLFFEEPEDLVLLCAACHMFEHGIKIKPKRNPKKVVAKKTPLRDTLPSFRRKLKLKTGRTVKGGRGWIGLARLVAIAFGETCVSGTKSQARRYIKIKFNGK